MNKKLLLIVLIFSFVVSANAQTVNKPDTKWFEDAKFGMFIHFGPYSVLGNGEWVMQNRPVEVKEYKKLQQFFNPMDFDARKWVKIAKDSGMKYITFTSRHHDGFSMWDTKQSDWNIMNTPHFGRDLIKELADECHKEGIKLVFYYSLIDWSRDDYQYRTGNTGQGCGRTERGNWEDYINFMKKQLTELLSKYGDIAGIWFDGDWDQHPKDSKTHATSRVDWHYDEIYDLIHKLQPNALVCNNHHKETLPGEDYQAFERDLPGENKAGYSEGQAVSKLPLETCETMNKTWGYNLTDDKFKTETELLHYLINAAGHGANLLLNVGPMPNGEIQPECVALLKKMGDWTKQYGYTIFGAKPGVVKPNEWGATTQNDKTHYIHIYDKEKISLSIAFTHNVKSVKAINSDGQVTWKADKKNKTLNLDLTQITFDPIDTIIEIVVK